MGGKEAPEALQELEDLNAADVIVTHGQYDHIEQVFGQGGIPCTAVDGRQIDNANLRPDQVIFVNCPGHFSPQGRVPLHHGLGAEARRGARLPGLPGIQRALHGR